MPDTQTLETTLAEGPEQEHPGAEHTSHDGARWRAPSHLSRHAAAAAEAAYILEAVRK